GCRRVRWYPCRHQLQGNHTVLGKRQRPTRAGSNPRWSGRRRYPARKAAPLSPPLSLSTLARDQHSESMSLEPPPEVLAYYEQFAEEPRLTIGPVKLEFARTKEILERVLPSPPARIIDVGGAAGTYSAWLASLGYAVHLVDASGRLVEEARKHNASLA